MENFPLSPITSNQDLIKESEGNQMISFKYNGNISDKLSIFNSNLNICSWKSPFGERKLIREIKNSH